ncbi:MAG: protein translocase subunit SecD, partial [Deltaproteobacteria bacterium]|nr:protein translocase subunit SecD [Deltaproteobacteria bacterium]
KLEKALTQKVRVFSSQVQTYLQDKKIADPKSTVEDLGSLGEVVKLNFAKAEEKTSAQAAIQSQFGSAWEVVATNLLPEGTIKEGENPDQLMFLKLKSGALEELKEDSLSQAVSTVRNRIDRFGVAEPSIRRAGDQRLVVEMPGEEDPDRVLDLIMQPGRLEFRLVDDRLSQEELSALISEARKATGLNAKDFSDAATQQLNDFLKDKLPENTEIAWQYTSIDPKTKLATEAKAYLLNKNIPVSGDMLDNAQVGTLYNDPYVSLSFDNLGTKAFGELTKINQGKQLAIVLDGKVNSAPVIKEPILTGNAQISLGFGTYDQKMQEAKDLVLVLREGALPAELKEATKTVIGPSLGERSVERGMQALVLAALAIMVFMAIWYKGAGLIADVALIFNMVFIFAILTLFGATLTLPGLAGIVLTLGMAVDANVIILERIKEELKSGKKVRAAVEEGYAHAKSAIVDANLTTFLAGVVLYQFGTGPVRGFAVTLMVGILTTLYTAMLLTKIFYEFKASRRGEMKISL